MAKWPIVGYDGIRRINGPDGFHAFGGLYFADSDEANSVHRVWDAYTASNLRCYISDFLGGAGEDDVIMVFRVNFGDGNQTVTVNGTGEFEDASSTDSLADGDSICMESEDSAQGHNDLWTCRTFQSTLDSSSDFVPMQGAGGGTTPQWWSADIGSYVSLLGGDQESGGEANREITMRATRTLTDLRLFCEAGTGTTVIVVRRNGADPASGLTVSVNATGEFLDATNSVAYVAGDEVAYGSDAGGSETNISTRSVHANTSSGLVEFNGAGSVSSATYFAPSGPQHDTTELWDQVEAEGFAIIQFLFVRCGTFSETRTVRTRKNAINGGSSVSVTGTGFFEDLTGSDTLAAEDDLSIQQDAGSSGNNTYSAAVEWETDAGTPPAGRIDRMKLVGVGH